MFKDKLNESVNTTGPYFLFKSAVYKDIKNVFYSHKHVTNLINLRGGDFHIWPKDADFRR